MSAPKHVYPATVARVVDGDTVRLVVDVGFRMRYEDNFRLAGINAPELREEAGKAARDFLRELLPEGQAVTVETAKAGKYGRWLAKVFLRSETSSVNTALLAAGHAVEYHGGKR